jgi:hypothetical protein
MMLKRETVAALVLAAAVLSVGTAPVQAQFTKRLTQAMQSGAENRAIQEVVNQENKAIDAALSGSLSSGDKSAGETLYGTLKTDGRAPATGIGFKENTATMTDSSASSLKAIGAMLEAHSDLKLRIEAYPRTRTSRSRVRRPSGRLGQGNTRSMRDVCRPRDTRRRETQSVDLVQL